jgi:hypothetical protein
MKSHFLTQNFSPKKLSRPLLEKEMQEMQEQRDAEAKKRSGGSRAVLDDD